MTKIARFAVSTESGGFAVSKFCNAAVATFLSTRRTRQTLLGEEA